MPIFPFQFRAHALFCVFGIVAILLIFEFFPIDLWVQNHFYDATALTKNPEQRWFIDRENTSLEFWFHAFPRTLVTITGITAFLLAIIGGYWKFWRPYRQSLFFLACAIGLVPTLVAGTKYLTNIYCPGQTVLYGGDKPYVRVLESYPTGFHAPKRGLCFPAGHATVGFSLMALYFVLPTRHARLVSLIGGLALGWALGIFQMLRGHHYLSHVLITMVASWLVIIILAVQFRTAKVFQMMNKTTARP